jgi:type III restriction enzyme
VRNERQAVIYSFDGGERFEPDFVLFLQKKNGTGYEQFQIFIEPKGTHLIASDKWKEDFLLQLEAQASAVKTFADDNNYRIRGFAFYNRGDTARIAAIDDEITKLK